MQIFTNEKYIKDGKNVGIFRQTTQLVSVEHQHEFIEIIYILSGKAFQSVDGKEYRVKKGDIIFINYGGIHKFIPDDTFTFYNICFSPEIISDTIINADNAFLLLSLTAFDTMRGEQNGGIISFSGKECLEIEHILAAMLEEYQNDPPFSNKILESYINILITKMLRKTQLGIDQQDTQNIWQELLEYIDRNLDADLTLPALAKKCFYNPSYFSRIFKQKFHITPTEYVSRKRIEQAVSLLSNSNLSVDEIGFKVGFSDRSTFYAAFSKITGSTPSQYRNFSEK